MITIPEYFSDGKTPGAKLEHIDATRSKRENAEDLLAKVNRLLDHLEDAGVYVVKRDPDTGTQVSGSANGSGDGGFRLQSAAGRANSKHKLGLAVDVYDPDNVLDDYISGYDEDGGYRNTVLEQYGLYREHPDDTPGWCHLQSQGPGSGRRTYHP